ncbi:MAG: hypothetical protein Q4D32_02530 [Eubacteriales bacterium]|nr:hypothetical protein [Eubacteriales bacterium]
MKTGVFRTQKKDGSIYYRSSITFRAKHISLGSYDQESQAHQAYITASTVLSAATDYQPDDYQERLFPALPFRKWISLINFKNNGIYCKTPIYLRSNFFQYYLSPEDVLLFDADDLFYYSNHSIMRRGGHLFVAEYGMQTNIHSRYGIRNFARINVDYRFVNGNPCDYRYSNIQVINPYHGVTITTEQGHTVYTTRIHIHGDYLVGRYESLVEAAIAYNKARHILSEKGVQKHFEKNYIEELSPESYQAIYDKISISEKILRYTVS